MFTLLEGIFIDSNSLTGSIPSQIGLLTSIMRLFVTDNDLTGSIPSEIGFLTSLEMLVTDENRLMGSVPSEIGLLTNLNIIKISELSLVFRVKPIHFPMILLVLTQSYDSPCFASDRNSLTGTIPTEMEGLLSLDRLYMGEFC